MYILKRLQDAELELHRKSKTSGVIEGMVNPFERIMQCIRFSVKLPKRLLKKRY